MRVKTLVLLGLGTGLAAVAREPARVEIRLERQAIPRGGRLMQALAHGLRPGPV